MDTEQFEVINKIEEWRDLWYCVTYTIESYYATFKIYAIEGIDSNDKVLYHKKDSPSYPDPVENIEDAEICMSVRIKWDGCSDWWFHEGYFHGCSRKNVSDFGEVMLRCYDLAKKRMPTFNDHE